MGGWCIFRPQLSLNEFLEVSASAIMFCFGLEVSSIVSGMKTSMLAALVACIGFIWYAKVTFSCLLLILKLMDQFETSDPFVIRLNLVRNYCVMILCILGFSSVIYVCFSTYQGWPVVVSSISEFSFFLIESGQFYLFKLRKEYEGEVEEQNKDRVKDGNMTACVLSSPISTDIVFVRQMGTVEEGEVQV
jgi:hypothetical protein